MQLKFVTKPKSGDTATDLVYIDKSCYYRRIRHDSSGLYYQTKEGKVYIE